MVDFENLPSTKTPLNAENLNKMQFDQTRQTLTDCNNKELDSGVYYTNSATLNKPTEQSGSAGFLIVICKNFVNGDVNIIQYWLRYRDGQIYSRECSPATNLEYSDWAEISQIDSGWKDLSLTANFEVYSSTRKAYYKKIGKLVNVCGEVKPKAEVAAAQTTKIADLPVGFRPKTDVYTLCQGSLMNKWLLIIRADGSVCVERYGVGSNDKIPAGAWLPFNVTFFIA